MRRVDIVVFTSKLCNLRCRYCYELPLLGDKTRITLEQMERAFRNFDAFFRTVDHETAIRFCWHGGEPLLIEPDYYWDLFERQREVFAGSGHTVLNHVQTNLTVIDEARLDLLANGFDDVGVSLDLYGGLRVNAAGRDMEPRTLENLERVLEAGLKLGGITVLSSYNKDHMADVYAFYRDRGMSYRLLPLEPGLYESGQAFDITPEEILEALCEVADVWLTEAPPIRIEPIQSTLDALVGAAGHADVVVPEYDLTSWQWVILLDTDGRLLTYTEGFDEPDVAGNVFEQGYDEIIRGAAQRRKAERAKAMIAASCTDCEYFESRCNGFHVAEGGETMHRILPDGTRRCVVAKGLFRHLEQRLVEAEVLSAPGVLSSRYRQAVGLPAAGSIA